MSDLEDLYGFEKMADERAKALAIWRIPLRSLLTCLYLSADSLITGGRFSRQAEPKPQRGRALLSRISYLAQFFGTCPLEIGAHVDDAMSVVDHLLARQMAEALSYAHFCEIMPEVRKGFYELDADEAGFSLNHPNTAFAEAEARDVLLTELSLAFDTHPPPYSRTAFDRMIFDWPKLNGADIVQVVAGGRDHYLTAFRESALLSEGAYEPSLGFSREEFQRVRAALMALGDLCLGMATAAEQQCRSASRRKRQHWERECLEWVSPLLSRNFILGTTERFSGVPAPAIDRVVGFLTMDAERADFGNAGEGYLPPFMRLGNSLLFSPYALKVMMPERNLLYVINKRERTVFDQLVSGHLEPALLDEAAGILGRVPGVHVAQNVGWAKGEIDILAFQPARNVAMQIQAKAALPPQGARMTAQVEAQTLTAVNQLKRFESETATFRDHFCAQRFGRNPTPLVWVSAVLSRSGLGTARAWSAVEGIATLNPLLLRGVVARIGADPSLSLANFPAITRDLIEEIVKQTVKGWHAEKISLFGKEIAIPILDLDHERVALVRRYLFEC